MAAELKRKRTMGLARREVLWAGVVAVLMGLRPALGGEPATTRSTGPSSVATTQAWQPGAIRFEDVTEKEGLTQYLGKWMLGHAGAWGDVNGDGLLDLYVGSFADRKEVFDGPGAPLPNMLFINDGKELVLSQEQEIRLDGQHARTSGALLVDLQNAGKLDLVISCHAEKPGTQQSLIFEGDGKGHFKDVTPPSPPWPTPLGGRNIAAIDVDGDGLLDLLIADGGYKSGFIAAPKGHENTARTVLLKNLGNWKWQDITEEYGLPAHGTAGLGFAIGDVNNDGLLDVYIPESNRLYVTGPDRHFHLCENEHFPRPTNKNTMACGAAFGDLNGDGLLDLITTEHGVPAKMHVYLNMGIKDGIPHFEEITEQLGLAAEFPRAGITGVVVKATHVSIQDMDNDGRPDIVLSMIYQAEDGTMQPVVLRHLGWDVNGLPMFSPPPMNRIVGYYAPGPLSDFKRDGRLGMFLPSWFEPDRIPSLLLRNVTNGGHWLTVRVTGRGPGMNLMGVGAIVRVYRAGGLGKDEDLIGRRDIVIGSGYASGEEPLAHVGLGELTECDLDILWNGKHVQKRGVKVDQYLTVDFTGR